VDPAAEKEITSMHNQINLESHGSIQHTLVIAEEIDTSPTSIYPGADRLVESKMGIRE
jgi:hypothetical protein